MSSFKMLKYVLWLFLFTACYKLPPHLQNLPNDAKDAKPLEDGQNVGEIPIGDTTLKAYLNGKPAILIFYRGGWCPYCNAHFGQIATIENDLIKLGYHVLAISPDKKEKIEESQKKHQMKYEMISDPEAKIIAAFGLAYHVSDALFAQYEKWNIDLEEASGQKHHVLPVPAVYIIDADGVIRYHYANPDYKTRFKPELMLQEAKRLAPNIP